MDQNGKASVNGYHNGIDTRGASTIAANMLAVQPPRREDLQPAYAQTLQGESEDAATHGWYGSMSMDCASPSSALKQLLTTSQSPKSGQLLAAWAPFLFASSVRILTSPSSRAMSVSSPNSADSIVPLIPVSSRSTHWARSSSRSMWRSR